MLKKIDWIRLWEHGLKKILDVCEDIIVCIDQERNISYRNRAAKTWFGEGSDVFSLVSPESLYAAAIHGEWSGEVQVVNSVGEEVTLSQFIVAPKDDHGEVLGYISICRFSNSLYLTGKREFEDFANDVLENIIEGVVVTDANSYIVHVNRAFTDITGYKIEEVIGKKPSILSSGKHDKGFYEKMWHDLLTEGFWQGEIWNRHKNGNIYLQKLTIKAVKNQAGETVNYVSLIEDITEKKRLENQIAFQATHDMLTQLPNRRSFIQHLGEKLSSDNRRELAVLIMDVDRYKRVKDMYGYHAGDELLIAVANRLERVIGNFGQVYRLEGSEFAAIIDGLSKKKVYEKARTIIDHFRHPVCIDKKEYMVGINIGIGYDRKDGKDAETLYKNADFALRKAKEFGRNHIQFFPNVSVMECNLEVLSLEDSLFRAVEHDQFELYYQPQLNVRDGKIHGFEVLVRWKHPEHGLLTPMQFIPIAEDVGLVSEIDDLVMRKTCLQLVKWHNEGYPPLRASVNLSMKNFLDRHIVSRIAAILEETKVNPNQLVIELTESTLMNNLDLVINILQEIKNYGIKIALDDFGTGYSSLSYLKNLPIDFLKIDRSFLKDITVNPRSYALVRTMIQLANSLGIEVITEGIEEEEQLRLVREFGSNEAQGYLISKPLPKKDFEKLLGLSRVM